MYHSLCTYCGDHRRGRVSLCHQTIPPCSLLCNVETSTVSLCPAISEARRCLGEHLALPIASVGTQQWSVRNIHIWPKSGLGHTSQYVWLITQSSLNSETAGKLMGGGDMALKQRFVLQASKWPKWESQILIIIRHFLSQSFHTFSDMAARKWNTGVKGAEQPLISVWHSCKPQNPHNRFVSYTPLLGLFVSCL